MTQSNELIKNPQPKHKPKFGFFVYVMATVAVIGGFLFGYGTTVVSGAMLYIPKDSDMKPMDTIWKQIIVAITLGMAGIGALISGVASDIFGRKKLIVLSSLIFAIGAVVCAIAFNKWILLIGRTLLGIAIGMTSMIVPIYVSEAAPTSIRGTLSMGFNIMITLGCIFANVIPGIFSYIDPEKIGWRLMFGVAAVPAIIQFIGFTFMPESPRFLYEHSGPESCRTVLLRINNGDEEWTNYELDEIKASSEQQAKAKIEAGGGGFVLKRVLTTPHIRKALLLGCSLQIFQQFTGANTIFYYAGTIIKAAGVKDDHTNIWISSGINCAFLLGSVFPMYFIDRAGRKVLLIVSMVGILICCILMGTGFLLMNKDSAKIIQHDNSDGFNTKINNYGACQKYSNCDYCVTDENCGFCALESDKMKQGYCLPVNTDNPDTRSTTGYCSSATNSDTDTTHYVNKTLEYEWAGTYCYTKYTMFPIIVAVLFIFCYAIGIAPMPWILNAEFYPLWARSTCVAIATFINWFFNLLISLTFLSITEAITKFGSYYLYAGLTFVGLLIFIFFIPETKGLNLDEIEMLFMSKKDQRRMSMLRRNTFSNEKEKHQYDNSTLEDD